MNLNNLGTGRKFIKQILEHGNLRLMGFTPQQQTAALIKQKNPHNPNSRPK